MKFRPRRTAQRKCKAEGGKKAYKSELDARLAIANFPALTRPYRCPHAPHWHVTSQGRGTQLRGQG